MICLISPSFSKAEKFAQTQNLSQNEWFYLSNESDVLFRTNFHVLVIGEFEQHKLSWFEKIYKLAKERGSRK